MERNTAFVNAVTALNEKMRRDAQRFLFWSKFTGEIKTVEDPVNNDPIMTPSGQFIETSTKRAGAGLGDRMLFPMLLGLAGPGRRGDAVLVGYEEDLARKYFMLHYNQIRHAVPVKKGRKNYSNEAMLNMMEYSAPLLAEWHANQENYEVTAALYEGVGEMLYTPNTAGNLYGRGLGIKKRYHPNMYVWVGSADASGALSKVGDAGKFPTAQIVRDAVKNVNASDHSTDLGTNLSFTTYTVRAMRRAVMGSTYIKPLFRKNGYNFYGCIVSPEQSDTLRADSRYAEAQKLNLWKDLQDNPFVNGSIGFYENFIFFEDSVAIRGFAGAETDGSDLNILGSVQHVWDEANKRNPRYEPMQGMITEAGGKSNHIAIVFGASGLGKSNYEDIGYDEELFDYGNWKGLAASQMYGYGRLDAVKENDIMTLETAPTTLTDVYNKSSMLVVTWQ